LQHDDGESVGWRLDCSAEEEVDVLVASQSRRTQRQAEIDDATREPSATPVDQWPQCMVQATGRFDRRYYTESIVQYVRSCGIISSMRKCKSAGTRLGKSH